MDAAVGIARTPSQLDLRQALEIIREQSDTIKAWDLPFGEGLHRHMEENRVIPLLNSCARDLEDMLESLKIYNELVSSNLSHPNALSLLLTVDRPEFTWRGIRPRIRSARPS
jgi:hypothetical protein